MNNIEKVSQFIRSVENSLKDENYFAAIVVSLTLPDICAKVEYGDIQGNKFRYEKWISNFFSSNLNTDIKNINYLSAENIYQLRCSMLHEGTSKADTKLEKLKIDEIIPYKNDIGWDHIALSDTRIHGTIKTKQTIFLDIEFFCNQILSSVSNWISKRVEIDDKDLKLFSIVSAMRSENGEKITLYGI